MKSLQKRPPGGLENRRPQALAGSSPVPSAILEQLLEVITPHQRKESLTRTVYYQALTDLAAHARQPAPELFPEMCTRTYWSVPRLLSRGQTGRKTTDFGVPVGLVKEGY
jgi:hypothetical protein